MFLINNKLSLRFNSNYKIMVYSKINLTSKVVYSALFYCSWFLYN